MSDSRLFESRLVGKALFFWLELFQCENFKVPLWQARDRFLRETLMHLEEQWTHLRLQGFLEDFLNAVVTIELDNLFSGREPDKEVVCSGGRSVVFQKALFVCFHFLQNIVVDCSLDHTTA